LSRGSVTAFVEELQAGDRFELMAFNLQPKTLFNA
jgi:hypothetical protein